MPGTLLQLKKKSLEIIFVPLCFIFLKFSIQNFFRKKLNSIFFKPKKRNFFFLFHSQNRLQTHNIPSCYGTDSYLFWNFLERTNGAGKNTMEEDLSVTQETIQSNLILQKESPNTQNSQVLLWPCILRVVVKVLDEEELGRKDSYVEHSRFPLQGHWRFCWSRSPQPTM